MEKRIKKISLIVYLVIESLIYIAFILLDALGLFSKAKIDLNISSYLKYSAIIFNALSSILYFVFSKRKENLIVSFALLFTLVSDYFLLFGKTNKEFIIGVSFLFLFN